MSQGHDERQRRRSYRDDMPSEYKQRYCEYCSCRLPIGSTAKTCSPSCDENAKRVSLRYPIR